MAYNFKGLSGGASGGGPITFAYPVTPAVGDVAVTAVLRTNDNSITMPSGFSGYQSIDAGVVAAIGGKLTGLTGCYRVCDGTETNITWTDNGAGSDCKAAILFVYTPTTAGTLTSGKPTNVTPTYAASPQTTTRPTDDVATVALAGGSADVFSIWCGRAATGAWTITPTYASGEGFQGSFQSTTGGLDYQIEVSHAVFTDSNSDGKVNIPTASYQFTRGVVNTFAGVATWAGSAPLVNPTSGFRYEITSRRVNARELPYQVTRGMFERELG